MLKYHLCFLESVSLMVRNLSQDVEDGKIMKFFKKRGIQIKDIRRTGKP